MGNSSSGVQATHVLLDLGANPNDKSLDGNTALHIAASKDHVEVIRVLVQVPRYKQGYRVVW